MGRWLGNPGTDREGWQAGGRGTVGQIWVKFKENWQFGQKSCTPGGADHNYILLACKAIKKTLRKNKVAVLRRLEGPQTGQQHCSESCDRMIQDTLQKIKQNSLNHLQPLASGGGAVFNSANTHIFQYWLRGLSA